MTIYEAWNNGYLKLAHDKNVLLPSIPIYCEIYQAFKRCRADGNKYKLAIDLTADAMCVSPFTVRRAIRTVSK